MSLSEADLLLRLPPRKSPLYSGGMRLVFDSSSFSYCAEHHPDHSSTIQANQSFLGFRALGTAFYSTLTTCSELIGNKIILI